MYRRAHSSEQRGPMESARSYIDHFPDDRQVDQQANNGLFARLFQSVMIGIQLGRRAKSLVRPLIHWPGKRLVIDDVE